ncbi:hypothetical protein D1872_221660 [compost metagenome]
MHVKEQQMTIHVQFDQSYTEKRSRLKVECSNETINADFCVLLLRLSVLDGKWNLCVYTLYGLSTNYVKARS